MKGIPPGAGAGPDYRQLEGGSSLNQNLQLLGTGLSSIGDGLQNIGQGIANTPSNINNGLWEQYCRLSDLGSTSNSGYIDRR